jgi:hypothetical protein
MLRLLSDENFNGEIVRGLDGEESEWEVRYCTSDCCEAVDQLKIELADPDSVARIAMLTF